MNSQFEIDGISILGVDGREHDIRSLERDVRNLAGDRTRVIQAIEPSESEQKPPSPPSEEEAKKTRNLEKDHAVKMLELTSARRTLRTYRRGLFGLLTATLTGAGMGLASIATAIGSSLLAVDASTAVAWLASFGWPVVIGGIASLIIWDWTHRLDTTYRKGQSYPYDFVKETVDYVDPYLNVEIAELNYSIALTRLTEHKGQMQ